MNKKSIVLAAVVSGVSLGAYLKWHAPAHRGPATVTMRASEPSPETNVLEQNTGAAPSIPEPSSTETAPPAASGAGKPMPVSSPPVPVTPPVVDKVPGPSLSAVAKAGKDNAIPGPSKPSGKEMTLPRLALGFVGADPEAEAVWAYAINDPNLPPNERKDLIEDLNEDGIPDPKHLTVDDLPLILSRMQIIEQLAPSAMDEVNAAAFAEAYKDLIEMADKIVSR